MRQVKPYTALDGTVTYRVRYRAGSKQCSETFRRRKDAETFAKLLDISVTDALRWLHARDTRESELTFAQWHETYVDQLTGVTPRTKADYRALRRRYLSELDDLPLPLITRAHVTRLVNDLDNAGRSAKTIKNTIHMLSACLSLAVEEGHITRNPCRGVRLPKRGHDEPAPRFLTHEEFGRLYRSIPEHYQPLVAFLAGTGLRWSEATALEARHIDLTAGTVRVERAWKRVPGGFEIGTPKSEKSRRTVNAAVMALTAVEPLLRRPNDLVFTSPLGRPVSHSNFHHRIWQPACKKAGLIPAPGIHDLRRTHASWLISDGQSLEAIQDQLGHESITTTRKVYGHLLPALGVEVGRSASAALERALAVPPNHPELPAAVVADRA